MWLVFVDDTKQRGLRKGMGQLLALAAVAFREDAVQQYAQSVAAIYSSHGVPEGTELKWSIRKDSWFKGTAGAAVLTEIREECLEAALAAEARATAVVFDLGRTTIQGKTAEARVLEYLFERVSMMMAAPEDRAAMICDKPGGGHKDEDGWIADTLRLTNFGTNYVKPGSVILPILTAPSHHHPHLQLADLIAGSLTAAIAGVRYGLDLTPKLRPLLHTNNLGTIPGTGLKLFPDDLVNLYYWALGCDEYTRGSVGIALPQPSLDYAQDDGMSVIANLRSRHASKRLGGQGDEGSDPG